MWEYTISFYSSRFPWVFQNVCVNHSFQHHFFYPLLPPLLNSYFAIIYFVLLCSVSPPLKYPSISWPFINFLMSKFILNGIYIPENSQLISTNKRKYITFVLLGLGYLAQDGYFLLHLFIGEFLHNFLTLNSCIILCCLNPSHFYYPLIS